ncbi:MAG: hypothetical protein QM639_04415 [Rhodocyclaceae bacterium]
MIKQMIRRARLRMKERSIERQIRRADELGQQFAEHAAYYHGELMPALSLQLVGLRREMRAHEPRPVLGQVQRRPA